MSAELVLFRLDKRLDFSACAFSVLSTVEAEEVESWFIAFISEQGVNDPGFLRFQLEPHSAYPFCDILFRCFDDIEVLMYDDKVISIADDLKRSACTFPS